MKTRRSVTLALTGLLTMLLATTGLGLATVPAQASPLCNNPVGGYTGAGTLADPYLVTNADQLCNVRDNLNAYYRQTANIDLSSYANWDPIGVDNITPFTGTYDGNGWTVGNLAITSIADNQGLFGVNTGTITNANVAGIVANTGGNNVGLLAGTSTGTITKSYATGSIDADGFQIGGLIGTTSGGTVADSSTNVTITGTANNVGGLIGLADGTAMTRVYATGTTNGNSTVGGLIGSINGSNGSTTTLADAYSTGAVTAPDTAGGLIGLANARQTLVVAITTVNISNVFSQASVTGGSTAGGLIGYISSDLANEAVSLTDAYSTGAVTGTTATGGLIGADNGNVNHTVTSTYWDTQTSGQATSDFGSPQTTAEMANTATYIGWAFPPSIATWGMCPAYNSGYPFLWSMEINNPCGGDPVVTGITPTTGPAGGGTTVNITGVDLNSATVTFGGTAGSVNSTTPRSINVTTPAHSSGIVDVAVTNGVGTVTPTGVFTFTATPAFASVTPNTGTTLGGTDITITGTDFLPTNLAVTVGGNAATNVTWVNGTTITATTPAGAVGAADIVVTDVAGTDTGVGAFTYITPPTVTSVAPNNGTPAGGTPVTITGSDFATGATVTVGGVAATSVTVVNSTTITATTPAHAAGIVDVVVTNPDTISGTGVGVFTYNAAPTVTNASPASGTVSGGTSVVLTGTGFLNGATVTFDGVAATGVTVNNDTTITVTTPAHAAALVDVVVTNSDTQTATLTNGYTYTANPSAPSVTSITPTSGPDTGNNASTIITGTGFVTGATVTFGGTAATDVFVLNATTITATTPAHAAGIVNVVVTNPDLQDATLAAGYTFTTSGGGGTPPGGGGGGGSSGGSGGSGGGGSAASQINELRPSTGSTAGGTTVLILGYGFWGANGATFGGKPVQSFKWIDAATIEIVTPPGVEGWQEVRVLMPGGSVPAAFKYAPPTDTPPVATTTQVATPPVLLPRKIKFNKWTRLYTGPVTTNANQTAALNVIALTPTGKVSTRGFALKTMKNGRVFIKVTRKHLAVTVALSAPATTGFTAYLQARTYRP